MLLPERWIRIEPLLDAALDLDEEDRNSFLDRSCDGDPELREAVARLLRSCEGAGRFLMKPAAETCARLVLGIAAPDPVEGARIGPYRVLSELGHGGMGVVYLAERADDQYRKRVALKLVRAGVGHDPHLVRRFLEERQILASLDHPHIARLLDGGVTDNGLPWFALEYVEGQPIDRYADAHRLSIDQRLELFLDVCRAVQYAHRNLVVHRDLKPSNVLVTEVGGVKLLDFGIAKLLEHREGQDTTLTGTGARVMTPEYASPEQVRGQSVSTATDVYSLGVLLYLILTGERPYRLADRTPHEVERAILELEPEAPSSRLSRAEGPASAARGMSPGRLRRRLRGDLDTIVLTAMRKEADRRYPSAEQLAGDVRRHLDGLPVSARRDTWVYRAGKLVRRHPLGAAASAAFLLVLASFSVVTAVQSARVRAGAELAARERDRAEEVAKFLTDVLTAPDPIEGEGAAVTVREVLDSAVPRLAHELRNQPDVRADLLRVVGRSYLGLGLVDEAQHAIDSAIALRRRSGRDEVAVANDQALLANVANEQGRPQAAESLARASLATLRRLRGDGHPSLTPTLIALGFSLINTDRSEQADSFLSQAIAVQRAQSPDSLRSLGEVLATLGYLRLGRGQWASAESLSREAVTAFRATLGEEHPEVGMANLYLGRVLLARSDTTAHVYFGRALEISRKALGEEHKDVVFMKIQLARALATREDLAAAESLYDAALRTLRRGAPTRSDSVWIAEALRGKGELAMKRGNPSGADPLLREAIGIINSAMPDLRATFSYGLLLLGQSLVARQKYAEAEPVFLEYLDLGTTQWGETHESTRRALGHVVAFYDAWEKPAKAQQYRARLEERRK